MASKDLSFLGKCWIPYVSGSAAASGMGHSFNVEAWRTLGETTVYTTAEHLSVEFSALTPCCMNDSGAVIMLDQIRK